MKRTILVLLAVTFPAAVLALGCLIKEEIHTLYLTPEGSVTWTVLEKDVRSNSDDPGVARKEEEEFLEQSWSGEQPAALELRTLSPDSLRTRILRDEHPFSVLTEAGFASAEVLARSVLERSELRGDAELQTAGGTSRLIVKFYPPPEDEPVPARIDGPGPGVRADDRPINPDEGGDQLKALLKRYKIVLNRGKFVESRGFHISEDRQEAYLEPMTVKEQGEPDGALVYWLTWESAGVE